MRVTLFIATGLTLCAVVFFVFGLYAVDHFTGSAGPDQRFTVEPNENALELGERLEQRGIVFSRYAFLWHLVREGKTRSVIAGDYLLSGNMTVPEVALIVTSGRTISSDVRVTLPEGFTMKQIADRLTENHLPGQAFLALAESPMPEWRARFDFLQSLPPGASLEGYLFPDTYQFAQDATAEDIVVVFLQNFGKKWDALVSPTQGNDEVFDPAQIHALVTMASIIEEEGRTKDERDMISDVFRKRLTIGQPLQSDATVNYIHGTTRLQPTLKDIGSDSPYNTYKNVGLPPGPISNPGNVSLRSALYPKSNPFYYFLVSAKTNETIYSITFEEHVRNRSLHGL